MYFFIEKHIIINSSVYPKDFYYVKARNLFKVREHLLGKIDSDNPIEIRKYYDKPYHCLDYLTLDEVNVIFRYGKVERYEIEDEDELEIKEI